MEQVIRMVRVIWLPKVFSAFSVLSAPRAREMILLPPMPMAIPRAAIKKDTGKTTLIAAMAIDPIQFPTNTVSIRMFRLITRMPMDAGTACRMSRGPMGSLPSCSEVTFAMEILVTLQNYTGIP